MTPFICAKYSCQLFFVLFQFGNSDVAGAWLGSAGGIFVLMRICAGSTILAKGVQTDGKWEGGKGCVLSISYIMYFIERRETDGKYFYSWQWILPKGTVCQVAEWLVGGWIISWALCGTCHDRLKQIMQLFFLYKIYLNGRDFFYTANNFWLLF